MEIKGDNMSAKWFSTKIPGVRFRKHKSRKNGVQFDRYYAIYYQTDGKRKEEGIGWASEKWTPTKALTILGELKTNHRIGSGPQTLAEMRKIEKARRDTEEKKKALQEQKQVTFDALAQEFLKWGKANKKDYLNDQGRYENHIKPILGDLRAKDVSPFILEKLKRDLQKKKVHQKKGKPKAKGKQSQKEVLSPKTIHHCLTLIRSIYRKAKTWDLYDGEIPTEKIAFPKLDNKRIRFLSHKEAKTLLDTLKEKSDQVHDEALLSLHCGLRFSEIAKLIWADVDLENDILQIKDPKGDSRQAYITGPLKERLSYLDEINKFKPDDLIFPARNGKRQIHVSSTFYRKVKELGFNEGITDRRQRACFHTLRHSFGSWLALQGTSLYEIMELLGQKDIKMAQRYAHLQPNVKRKAVNLMAEAFKQGIEQENKTNNIIELNDKK